MAIKVTVAPLSEKFPRLLLTVDFGETCAKYRFVQTDAETVECERTQDRAP